jgi:hypothetical protein
MIAVFITIAIICVLIFLLRGPSTKTKNKTIKASRPKDFSKYLVNKNGWLEMAEEDKNNEL